MTYDNTNRGAVFPNKNKQSEKSPTHTGSINVDGVDYWLSGWVNQNKGENKPSMTFSVKRKDVKPSSSVADESLDIDDSIPF